MPEEEILYDPHLKDKLDKYLKSPTVQTVVKELIINNKVSFLADPNQIFELVYHKQEQTEQVFSLKIDTLQKGF